ASEICGNFLPRVQTATFAALHRAIARALGTPLIHRAYRFAKRPSKIKGISSMSSHRLVSGTRRVRVSGVLVRNSQPWRSRDHAAALHRRVVSDSRGSSFSVSATTLQPP